jgi:hypothetical protein
MALKAKFQKLTSSNGKFGAVIDLIREDEVSVGELEIPARFLSEARAKEVADEAIAAQHATGRFPNLCAITE